jgi:hypothetical protein
MQDDVPGRTERKSRDGQYPQGCDSPSGPWQPAIWTKAATQELHTEAPTIVR